MRIVLILLISIHFVLASYDAKGENSIGHYITKSLDLPTSFLYSKKFQKIKREYARYKNHHFFNVNKVETYFVPELVKIINAYNIPDVFLFMALAESNFAVKAKSHKKAVGIWQFMPATAKKYGLRIDEFVDERRDPYRSTNAAIKYLKRLHKMFGKWYLAALAYNAGEGAVKRAIKRAGTDDVRVLLDEKKRYLPKESRRYLYKIVMLALMANDNEYMLNSDLAYILTRGEEFDIMPVEIKGAELLDYVANKIKLRLNYLQDLNPHIKRGFTPPDVKKYSIYIPKLKFNEFKKFYKPSNSVRGFLVYKVKRGDSLYKIAHRYGIKIALIKKFNHLSSNLLRPNQKLILPIAKRSRRIYRVKKGDTILKIAHKFGVDAKKLKIWNDKKDNFLRIGEKLVVLY
ncbi:lytic transglycosylase domain-containing protein [Nitratiruptor tergarcus]|uniref:Membrane-bound lytic murein transglycosylase D n=1 Tax=Nitratiruptor tergarcus DSM 16512 TaxID=1069081 RepID=A0A1W1WTC5_9BACT|nr:lytic transglycosylase domain-containing protein [Nitratiruptor tergarcus]SMC09551.1 membrane-bound lytic murein transglycosylase D [Nitratiruptor tergarcus DSM 16512]